MSLVSKEIAIMILSNEEIVPYNDIVSDDFQCENGLYDIPDEWLNDVEVLDFENPRQGDFAGIDKLKNLKSLKINDEIAPIIEYREYGITDDDLENIYRCNNLKDLEIINQSNIKSINLGNFPKLKNLKLINNVQLADVDFIDKIEHLDILECYSNSELYGIPYLNEAIKKANPQVQLSLTPQYYLDSIGYNPENGKIDQEAQDILEKIGNSGQTNWIEPVIYNVTENLNLKMEYSQVRQMYEKAKTIIDNLDLDGLSPIKQISLLENWITQNVQYDEEGKDKLVEVENDAKKSRIIGEEKLSQLTANSEYDVLTDKKGVCEGIARTEAFLSKFIKDADAYSMLGSLNSLDLNAKINHSIVRWELDNGYYYSDPTTNIVALIKWGNSDLPMTLLTVEEMNSGKGISNYEFIPEIIDEPNKEIIPLETRKKIIQDTVSKNSITQAPKFNEILKSKATITGMKKVKENMSKLNKNLTIDEEIQK